MKKNVLRAAAFLLSMLLMCSGAMSISAEEASAPADAPAETQSQKTETAPNKDSEKPNAVIDDLSLTDTYELFCENDSFAMSFSKEGMFLRVTDKRSGKEWYSTPPGVWSSTPAINKPERMSLITVTYIDKSGNENYAYSYTKSVKKGGAKLEPIKENGKTVGAKIIFDFKAECFTVPISIRLTDQGIDFSVLYDEIDIRVFNERLNLKYPISKVAIMPFFGAGEQGTEGYLVVPDGCGALVDFQKDNGSVICDYNQVMYGRDSAKVIKAKTNFKERLMFPMYGIRNGKSACTAIVTEGDGRTELFYRVAGVKSNYNNIYFNFVYQDGDIVTAKDKNWDRKDFKIFEEYKLTGKHYTVSYRFTNDEKADYVGMAEVYRNYLMKEKGMKTHAEADYAPLNVELIAAIRRPVSILGFPINKIVPLTNFEDVQFISHDLKEKGVSQLAIDYVDWYKGATDDKIPSKVKAEGALGSEKDLREMTAALKKDGTRIYANLDLVNIRTNGNGYHKKNSVTRSLDKQPTMLYMFNPSNYSGYKSESKLRKVTYMLSPVHYAEASKGAADTLKEKDYGFYGVADSQLGSHCYSDYGKKGFERIEGQKEINKAMKNLAGVTGELMLNNPNGSVLPYATYVGSTPIQNSGYYTFTRTIPLYQLVIQGVVNNSTTVLNEDADLHHEMLKAVETGSGIKVRWFKNNMRMIDVPMAYYLINAQYDMWVDQVAEEYKAVAPFLRSVSDQKIVGHTYLEDNVTKTTFENGKTVVVNYNFYDVTVDGKTVKARDFMEGRA